MAELPLMLTALIVIGFGILTIGIGVYLLLSNPPDDDSFVTGRGEEFTDDEREPK